jgi:hypothetical protein
MAPIVLLGILGLVFRVSVVLKEHIFIECYAVNIAACYSSPNASLYINWLIRLIHFTHTGRFIIFSVIKNIFNKLVKAPTLMKLFTATGKLKI